MQRLYEYMSKRIAQVGINLLKKIDRLSTGKVGIPWNDVQEVYPVVVTYQSLYPEEHMRHVLPSLMQREGYNTPRFEWMNVQGFEDWLGDPSGDPMKVLRKKWGTEETKGIDVRTFLSLPENTELVGTNRLLESEMDAFFIRLTGRLLPGRMQQDPPEGVFG